MDPVGYSDTDEVEDEHGTGEEAHADGVGEWADDGGDEEDDEDGVADVFEEKFGVDDAEEGKEEDDDGEFEADAEAEDDGEEEAGVVLDGDHVAEVFAEVLDEDDHGTGENPVVSEPGSCEKERDGASHEREDVFLLVGVHAGGDEEPELIEDKWAGDDGAEDEGGLDEEIERIGGMRHGHLEADIDEGLLDVVDESDVEDVGDCESAEEIDNGADDALAELVEMLHEGHAGEFGPVGDGGAGAVDGVEVSHVGGGPRWVWNRSWCGGRGAGRWRTGRSREFPLALYREYEGWLRGPG